MMLNTIFPSSPRAEKALLVAQMETASAELKVVIDQSAKDITDAKSKVTEKESEFMSRISSVKAAIDKVTAEAIEINLDKEEIERSKQTMLDKVVQEGKNKMAQVRKSLDFDIDFAKKINADLFRRAEEAEQKVRDAFDQIDQMRSERVSLQQQIVNVENNALEEISSLQREQELDDERYAATLQKERDRLDKVIDVAYQAYAERICGKIKKRQAIEADYREKLRPVNVKITAAKAKQEARVKEYLDKLEENHKKERIEIYQEKFKAVTAIREQMNAELAIENAKIEETKKTMQAKIDVVYEQTAQVKADFEREMAKKRQLAKEEEESILLQIEDVRLGMTDKLKTQRRLYEEKKIAYLDEMNVKISDSEFQVRQAWKELAGIKESYNDVKAKRDNIKDVVAETQALIDAYESDRSSFRKSLRLTVKTAKEKIGSKTRNLLWRNNK
jgi:chromosome segregation ATPase